MNKYMDDSFRKSPYLDKYEYVTVELDTPIRATPDGQTQTTTGYYFSVDNTSETYPFDWYNAFLEVNFKVTSIANANIDAGVKLATVNSIYSFFKKISVNFNGVDVNNSSDINHCCYIKNLLENSASYKNVASNEFDYPDITATTDAVYRNNNIGNFVIDILRDKEIITGFQKIHQKISAGQTVSAILSFNRYGFFEALKYQICPQGKVRITIELGHTNSIIFRTAAAGLSKHLVTKMALHVPKLIFNSKGQTLFLNTYLASHEWNFFEENFYFVGPTTAIQGTWPITSSVSKPRHVFVWILNANKLIDQTLNKFFHDTFNVSNNNSYLSSCQLEVRNGNFYPTEALNPHDNMTIAYRMLMSFNRSYNERSIGSQLSLDVFKNLYGMIYFDLRRQAENLRYRTTKLTFKWRLNQAAAQGQGYYVYAVVLNEEIIKVDNQTGRAFLKKQ